MKFYNDIKLKRSTRPAETEDGLRIFVDRLWPRGVPKDALKCRMWAKRIAPSDELRRWYRYNRNPDSFEQFREKYFAELDASPTAEIIAQMCVDFLGYGNVTLVYDAPDPEKNNAAVLREWIFKKIDSFTGGQKTE